jgi:exonuclease SbcC
MRVHTLEITAFGPFADTQVIDFEQLNAAGVFLLTGPTGAGKTSVLDAICFGLFGQVPGVRDKAKAYRSDHAPAGLPPRVVLEVTLQGRRLRVTRQPTWSRPSSRAKAGFVEEKARAYAEELVGGTWAVRSSRVDEVGHLVSRLLGLNREQFCQVVMLPQGDFQAFLRAGGRDRQRILETLFGTQRFQAVERWLVEHRRVQARRCREQEERLGRLVARLHEVCSPAHVDALVAVPETTSDPPALLPAVRRLVEEARVTSEETARVASTATGRAKQARHAYDEARTLAERQARHLEALRSRAVLMATHDLVAARAERVRRARAAEALLPLVTLAAEAKQACASASRSARLAAARCPDLPEPAAGVLTADLVDDVLADLGERRSRLRGLVTLAADCGRLSRQIDPAARERARVGAVIHELDAQVASDPGVVAILRTELAEASKLLDRGAEAEACERRAKATLEAAREVARCDEALARLRTGLVDMREEAAAATERWLDTRNRHLAGLAAELAGTLVDDEPCPVCGSASHPTPAMPDGEQVTRQDEAGRFEEMTQAREAVSRAEAEVARAERLRGEALARSGGIDVPHAMAAAAAASGASNAAAKAAAQHAALAVELDQMVASAEGRRAARERAVVELAGLEERIEGYRAQLTAARRRLDAEIGTDVRVQDLLAGVQSRITAVLALRAAVRASEEAGRFAAQADARLAKALVPSEFDTAESVLGAALPEGEIANAEALNRSHAAELSAVDRMLSDTVLVAAAAEPAPDLSALVAFSDACAEAAGGAVSAATDAERRHARLDALVFDLENGVAELLPLRAAKDLADDVADLCTGSSPDNATRTALSHYVLAARLAQVVAAANLRLESIGGGRFQLEHTMVRSVGDTRGGLGLVMRDTHTDLGRDPATLSGGETFYVSLSLALGLADVVTNEAGGAELSTLFVDEGFGALDDETRDEVLDELDGLRSGGRSIGLVSHLGELRSRFPVQLQVVAAKGGSRCLPLSM